MSFSRYEERKELTNKLKLYRKALEDRGVNHIVHYSTPELGYPDPSDFSNLDIQTITWSHGQRYWKIAEKYYGNPEYWWVIAWFNKKPTEAHLNIGDTVLVPRPLEKILAMFGV